MEKKKDPNCSSADAEKDDLHELLQTLEQHKSWDSRPLVRYEGIWLPVMLFRPILTSRKHFKAESTDIILTTIPKSGTSWLKALTFSIANRNVFSIDQSPLLTSNPHTLVPFLEYTVYRDQENPELENIPHPRISQLICLSKSFLIPSVNLDVELSTSAETLWISSEFNPGTFWDHMLGYWNAHLKNPQKLLFLKYEDLKQDVSSHVKQIAEFIGFPFSGGRKPGKGEVGDWINHLTPAMAERDKNLTETKFQSSGLVFKM
ncbi:UNVERIFIED_CONTAM: Cytosolic sulfotransferase 15 [Sesamum calycinum]|uniref:Sulfotransferase n=1 Tax=Sesamum calycinum TaxID=2727403 RepID=A0AAW2QW67_9LAMI